MSLTATIHKPYVRWRAPEGEFGHGTMPVQRIVLHDTEAHDAPGVTEIEGIASWWARTAFPDRLGSHFIVDGDGNIGQCGEPNELMYHVGGLNTGSVGIEQIGFASFTEDDWLRRPYQLLAVSKLLAWLHKDYGIPLEVPARQGDGQPMHGVLTHAMVSRFEPASGGHTDPGSGYPLGKVLKMANGWIVAGGWPRGGALPGTPGAADGRQPPVRPKKTITVRGHGNLRVMGRTAGVKRYVMNPAHAGRIRRAMRDGHLHFDKDRPA